MTLLQRVNFLCGQLGIMLLARFLFQWINKYADQADAAGVVLMSTAAVSSLVFAFRIFDGVTDPFAAAFSDGWVKRGRERRTLLWYWFLIPSVGLVFMFMPGFGMSGPTRWALLTAGLFVFFVGYTFYAIPYWSLVEDYGGASETERRGLSNLLGVGLMLATAVIGIVSPFVVDPEDGLGYTWGAIAFAIPAALLMILPYWGQPERAGKRDPAVGTRDPAPVGEPSQESSAAPSERTAVQAFLLAFSHRRFVAVLIMFAGSQMSLTVLTTGAPFIAERLLGGDESDVAKIMGPLIATSIPAFALVPWFSRKLGWEWAVVVASLLLGVVYACSGGLGRAVIGDAWTTAMILFACGGPMIAVLLGLEGEAITACARERGASDAVSTYFGVYNFVVKALNGLALMVGGVLAGLARDPAWGDDAIRMMSYVAGGMLGVCVVIYFLVRPREGPKPDA